MKGKFIESRKGPDKEAVKMLELEKELKRSLIVVTPRKPSANQGKPSSESAKTEDLESDIAPIKYDNLGNIIKTL